MLKENRIEVNQHEHEFNNDTLSECSNSSINGIGGYSGFLNWKWLFMQENKNDINSKYIYCFIESSRGLTDIRNEGGDERDDSNDIKNIFPLKMEFLTKYKLYNIII